MWRVEVVVVEARFFSSLLHGYRSWILLILRRREDLQDSVPFAPWLRLDYRFSDARTNGLSSFLIRDLIEIGRNYQVLLIEVFIWFIMNLDWWFDGWLTSFESSISRTYKDLQRPTTNRITLEFEGIRVCLPMKYLQYSWLHQSG